MSALDLTHTLTETIKKLSESNSLKDIFHQHKDGNPIPSNKVLGEIIELLREILFPGYYGEYTVHSKTIQFHIGVNVEKLYHLLLDQILAGLCFMNPGKEDCSEGCGKLKEKAEELVILFIGRLPKIRRMLTTDMVATYNGDPAAKTYGEVILCYPVIKALINHRVAHELLTIGVPLIPRMMAEMAHAETGIDIHPGATIGEYFTIDHGTGVVIGETCIIGKNVKLYQGVTLGARSFPLDDDGNPIKGIARHPVLGDNVVIYSNATLLGRISIGEGCVIGANIWITEDIPAYTKIFKKTK